MAAISLTSRLSTVARRVLAQPVCGCARLPRSVIGLSTDRSKPLRARMGHATGDKLVFMHESLHTHAAEAADGRVPPARREVGLRLGLGQV